MSLRVRSLSLLAALPALALAQGRPAAAPQTPPGKGAPAADAARPGGSSEVEVRTLNEEVSDLEKEVFRSKARLANLEEMVAGGDATTGSRAVLVHRNEMGSSFRLESVAYALDGAPVYARVDQGGDLEKREEFEVFSGRLVPGNHQISVQVTYHGHGYGVFSYLEGYRYKVRSSYTFSVEPGKVSTIRVVGFEKGGVTAGLEDRPAIRYDVDVQREEANRGPAPAAAEGSPR